MAGSSCFDVDGELHSGHGHDLLIYSALSIDNPIYRSLSMDGVIVARQKMVAVLEADECCPTIGEAPLSEADAAELARGFAALADPARLRILSLLGLGRGRGGVRL